MQRGSSDQLDNPRMPFLLRTNPAHGRAQQKGVFGTDASPSHIILLMLTGIIAFFTVVLIGRGPEFLGLCSGRAANEAQSHQLFGQQPEARATPSAPAADSLGAPQNTSQATESEVQRHKVAVCTSIKWEQPQDIEEWVRYYRFVSLPLYLFQRIAVYR